MMNISVRTYRKIENEEIPLAADRKYLALKVLHITEEELLALDGKVATFITLHSTGKKLFEQILHEKEALLQQKDEEIFFLRKALRRSSELSS